MGSRISKRIYNEEALEFWFEKLTEAWEHHFPQHVLDGAREIYRDGEIREIELRRGDAIIHSKRDKFEYYALIEWENGSPSVRVSTEDKDLGHSLAAAGIYEIEELITEEIAPVTTPREKGTKPNDTSANGAVNIQPQPNGHATNGANGTNGHTPAKPKTAPGDRSLTVSIIPTEQGLLMDAHWIELDGKKDKPKSHSALRNSKRSPQLTMSEREILIRLTSRARKATFTYRSSAGNYIIRDPARIVWFVKSELAEWQRLFKVVHPQSLEQLKRGVQELSIDAAAKAQGNGIRFEWNVKLGKSPLSELEIRTLMRRPQQTILLPGRGLVRLEEEQAEALANWQSFITEDGTAELPNYMLFSLFGQEAIQIALSPELEDWRKALHAPAQSLKLPDFLRPYQARGVQWLAHLCQHNCHPLLADEMGLGKTVQMISLLLGRPSEAGRDIVVCPASVVPVWQAEAERFFPGTRVEVLKSSNTFADAEGRVLWISSYTQLRRHKHLLEDTAFGYAVLDEGQQIKNPEAKVTMACMALRAEHRIVLSGTPLENRPLDIWTLFRFLMPGLLGGRRQFTFAMQEEPAEATRRLEKQVAPFILRRTKKEVIKELPRKVEVPLVCPLSELQRAEYERIARQGQDEVGDNLDSALKEQSFTFLTLLTRLRQACCDPALLPWSQSPDWRQSGKLVLLVERVAEALDNGRKVVIFSQFVRLLERVKLALGETCPKAPIYELTGQTLDRAKPVKEFQQNRGAGVILVSLRAGGTGITLHAADYVFLLDPWWNPAVEEQAIDRVHRIGQRNTVFVYRMLTAGTIEQRIEELKSSKRELFQQVVGDIEDMSDVRRHFKSLNELIALREENSGQN